MVVCGLLRVGKEVVVGPGGSSQFPHVSVISPNESGPVMFPGESGCSNFTCFPVYVAGGLLGVGGWTGMILEGFVVCGFGYIRVGW